MRATYNEVTLSGSVVREVWGTLHIRRRSKGHKLVASPGLKPGFPSRGQQVLVPSLFSTLDTCSTHYPAAWLPGAALDS
jgi:hypothetical protein